MLFTFFFMAMMKHYDINIFTFILSSLFLGNFLHHPSINQSTIPEFRGHGHGGLLKPIFNTCTHEFMFKYKSSIWDCPCTFNHKSRAWSGCNRNAHCQIPPGQRANKIARGSTTPCHRANKHHLPWQAGGNHFLLRQDPVCLDLAWTIHVGRVANQ